eukprot:3526406-Pyramimonas_sp.AAC.1
MLGEASGEVAAPGPRMRRDRRRGVGRAAPAAGCGAADPAKNSLQRRRSSLGTPWAARASVPS